MTAAEQKAAAPLAPEDPAGPPSSLVQPGHSGLLPALARLDGILAARLAEASPQRQPVPSRGALVAVRPDRDPEGIAAVFDLSPVEVDLLVLAAAPELDSWYGRAFGLLQDDLTRRRPTVGWAVELLSASADRLAARALLGPWAPLVRHGLVGVEGAPGDGNAPFPDRELVVDARVIGHLLGDDRLDDRLVGTTQVVDTPCTLAELVLDPSLRDRLARLTTSAPTGLVELRGPAGSGREAVAGAIAHAWGVDRLIRVHVRQLPMADVAAFDDHTMWIIREARLTGAATYWDGVDALLAEGREPVRERWTRRVTEERFAFVARSDNGAGGYPTAAAVALTRPSQDQRAQLWAHELAARGTSAEPEEVALVASAFRFGPAAIADAVTLAFGAGSGEAPAELTAAARTVARRGLDGRAERVPKVADWDDLVLPADRRDQLQALVDHVRHRGVVHDAWGVDRAGGARGVCAMFVGPSGTGKTMAAGVVAGAIGLDLYRVDLARVVSKYIGETEKNLSRIFDAADAGDAVLFFDEADALFGRRSEVRDAHDRYANLEVSYLLQRIEAHGGVVMLSTNLRKNIDEAFLRRLHHVVEFPMPAAADRRRLWARAWPATAPVDPGLDRDALADRFELSGGSIRNVAVAAAVAAAAACSLITGAHVLAAVRQEHRKLGRIVADDLFITPLDRGPTTRATR